VPIAIQAAPPPSDTPGKTLPTATSAKKDNKFAALLDQARQATTETEKSSARASHESPAQKEARGKQSHGKDSQDDSTSRSPDAPAIEQTAAVPVPELSPLTPTSTQGYDTNVPSVKESGNSERSFPTAGVETPNTPVAETGKQTVAAVEEPRAHPDREAREHTPCRSGRGHAGSRTNPGDDGTRSPQSRRVENPGGKYRLSVPPTRTENLGHYAISAELSQPAVAHAGAVAKQSVTTRSPETGTNPEQGGGVTAAPSTTPALQLADRPAVPLSNPPAASPVSAHVSPDMHTPSGSPVPPGRDSVLPATEASQAPSPVTGRVHDARLMARPEQAEMHIALQTAAFGNVEVHAVVSESQVGLAIGSERGDLHRILANEVPGLAGRLQQHDLHLDAVKFFDQGLSFNAGSDGANSRSRAFSSPPSLRTQFHALARTDPILP
jgi:hypothetical protein